ncbi:MAG: flagellar protein FlaG [Deltaproteobacteria bacterium]|nr:flagellar protein FlaG [Deltaproteobacteria bacterium]
MMVEIVQNTGNISPMENSVDSARVKSEKTISQQNEPIPKETHGTEISPSLLNQIQQNINIMHNVSLQFSMHEATGRTMVNVTEQETGKLIRQIPPEQILDLAAKIDDMLGILFDKKV